VADVASPISGAAGRGPDAPSHPFLRPRSCPGANSEYIELAASSNPATVYGDEPPGEAIEVLNNVGFRVHDCGGRGWAMPL